MPSTIVSRLKSFTFVLVFVLYVLVALAVSVAAGRAAAAHVVPLIAVSIGLVLFLVYLLGLAAALAALERRRCWREDLERAAMYARARAQDPEWERIARRGLGEEFGNEE